MYVRIQMGSVGHGAMLLQCLVFFSFLFPSYCVGQGFVICSKHDVWVE